MTATQEMVLKELENGNLTRALKLCLQLQDSSEYSNVKLLAKKELCGYEGSDDLPSYRKGIGTPKYHWMSPKILGYGTGEPPVGSLAWTEIIKSSEIRDSIINIFSKNTITISSPYRDGTITSSWVEINSSHLKLMEEEIRIEIIKRLPEKIDSSPNAGFVGGNYTNMNGCTFVSGVGNSVCRDGNKISTGSGILKAVMSFLKFIMHLFLH